MWNFIQTILPPLISIFAAFMAAKLSISQFYSQRIWEKRVEAYSHILEHLSYLQYCFSRLIDDAVDINKLGGKDKGRLSGGYKKAMESLAKATAIGAFIVSEDTAAALEKLSHELEEKDPEGDYAGDYERYHGSVKACIRKIRGCGKEDLFKKRRWR